MERNDRILVRSNRRSLRKQTTQCNLTASKWWWFVREPHVVTHPFMSPFISVSVRCSHCSKHSSDAVAQAHSCDYRSQMSIRFSFMHFFCNSFTLKSRCACALSMNKIYMPSVLGHASFTHTHASSTECGERQTGKIQHIFLVST